MEWYDGQEPLEYLAMKSCHIAAIHANAFNGHAFIRLSELSIDHNNAILHLNEGAFMGLRRLLAYDIAGTRVHNVHTGLFDSMMTTISSINYKNCWPSDINLNEMFAVGYYRQLHRLSIRTLVTKMQNKFHRLAADNFTSLIVLANLVLFDCGIEVIDEHAFNRIGKTLKTLVLSRNRIVSVHLEMFRIAYEHQSTFNLFLEANDPPLCNCDVMEMQLTRSPFFLLPTDLVHCDTWEIRKQCGHYFELSSDKTCVTNFLSQEFWLISVQLRQRGDSISMRTNFHNKYRLLLVNLDAMQGKRKCAHKALSTNFQCWNVDKSIEQVPLHGFDAVFVMIVAQPVVHPRGMRPYNFIVLRSVAGNNGIPIAMSFLIIGVAGISGILIGGIAGGIYRYRRSNEEQQTNVTKAIESVRESIPNEYSSIAIEMQIDDIFPEEKTIKNDA